MNKNLTMCVSIVLLAAGCRSIGPDTVSRDRFDYTTAISDRILLLRMADV